MVDLNNILGELSKISGELTTIIALLAIIIPKTRKAIASWLKEGLGLNEIKEKIQEQSKKYDELREKGDTAVTDEEISAYYEKYPYQMTIKQIIIDNAQTADQVLRALKSSPRRWKELDRQYSIAPESLKELSFMPGEYLPEIEVIAANSPTGSVQGFFKTSQGFHIIMKTSDKRLSRKDAEPRIRQVLENKKLDNLLNTLKNKYEVVKYKKSE